jgi:hypothetical protein
MTPLIEQLKAANSNYSGSWETIIARKYTALTLAIARLEELEKERLEQRTT